MPNDEFALALTDTKNDKRPIKDQLMIGMMWVLNLYLKSSWQLRFLL